MPKLGCAGCGACEGQVYCEPFQGDLNPYFGIRFTADGFDCALPVAIDSHNTCSYRCQYCFSNYLARDPLRKDVKKVGQLRLSILEKFLKGGGGNPRLEKMYHALDHRRKGITKHGPVQLGALGDPFDRIERHQGWTLEAMKLFEKYEQPVRISTKGGDLLQSKLYRKAFSRRPELYWIAFSIISADDEILAKVDKDAPVASERLKAMKVMSDLGVKTSLRFRPIIPGISDTTPNMKHAWKRLLEQAAEAGAQAVSMEFTFVPGAMPKHIKRMWNEIEHICQWPIIDWYKKTTVKHGACLRSSRAWKEDMTFAIRERAHELGMTFAISDPHWKELNDYGCCCGIPPDDPVFGGWSRYQATNALVVARDKGIRVSAKDGIPDWSKETPLVEMVCITGPKSVYNKHYVTWADKLKETWNDLQSPRGPLQYFEGALKPVGRDVDGDVLYEYDEPKRKHRKAPYITL